MIVGLLQSNPHLMIPDNIQSNIHISPCIVLTALQAKSRLSSLFSQTVQVDPPPCTGIVFGIPKARFGYDLTAATPIKLSKKSKSDNFVLDSNLYQKVVVSHQKFHSGEYPICWFLVTNDISSDEAIKSILHLHKIYTTQFKFSDAILLTIDPLNLSDPSSIRAFQVKQTGPRNLISLNLKFKSTDNPSNYVFLILSYCITSSFCWWTFLWTTTQIYPFTTVKWSNQSTWTIEILYINACSSFPRPIGWPTCRQSGICREYLESSWIHSSYSGWWSWYCNSIKFAKINVFESVWKASSISSQTFSRYFTVTSSRWPNSSKDHFLNSFFVILFYFPHVFCNFIEILLMNYVDLGVFFRNLEFLG